MDAAAIGLQDLLQTGAIGAAVVHYDNVEVRKGLRESRVQSFGDVAGGTIGRNDDAYSRHWASFTAAVSGRRHSRPLQRIEGRRAGPKSSPRRWRRSARRIAVRLRVRLRT